jgi:hypothetical protein
LAFWIEQISVLISCRQRDTTGNLALTGQSIQFSTQLIIRNRRETHVAGDLTGFRLPGSDDDNGQCWFSGAESRSLLHSRNMLTGRPNMADEYTLETCIFTSRRIISGGKTADALRGPLAWKES